MPRTLGCTYARQRIARATGDHHCQRREQNRHAEDQQIQRPCLFQAPVEGGADDSERDDDEPAHPISLVAHGCPKNAHDRGHHVGNRPGHDHDGRQHQHEDQGETQGKYDFQHSSLPERAYPVDPDTLSRLLSGYTPLALKCNYSETALNTSSTDVMPRVDL